MCGPWDKRVEYMPASVCQTTTASAIQKSGSDGPGQVPVLPEKGAGGPFMDTQGTPTEGLQPQSAASLGVAARASPYRPVHP